MNTSPIKHGHMIILHAYIILYRLRNALFVAIPQLMQHIVIPLMNCGDGGIDLNSSTNMYMIYDDILVKDQTSTSFCFITSPFKDKELMNYDLFRCHLY